MSNFNRISLKIDVLTSNKKSKFSQINNKPFSVRIGSSRSRVRTYMQLSYILMIKKNSESQQKIQVFLLNKTKAVKRQKQIF